jgi:hypothetical protein
VHLRLPLPPLPPATADKSAHPLTHEKTICFTSHVARLRFQVLRRETWDLGRETVFSEQDYKNSVKTDKLKLFLFERYSTTTAVP